MLLPSSHSSTPSWTNPSWHVALTQLMQASVFTSLPSSHCSPGSTTPLPQVLAIEYVDSARLTEVAAVASATQLGSGVHDPTRVASLPAQARCTAFATFVGMREPAVLQSSASGP